MTGGTKVSNGGATAASTEELVALTGTVDGLVSQVNSLVPQVSSLVAQIDSFIGEDYLTETDAANTYLTKTDAANLYQGKAADDNPYVVASDISEENAAFKTAVSGVVTTLGGDGTSIKSWVTTEYGDAPDTNGTYVLNRTSTGAQWKKVDDYATNFDEQGISFED